MRPASRSRRRFADYLLPGPTEVPAPRLDHMETPSPYTQFGVKGIGEGGAIAPPAAIANAVNDALRPLGVELMQSPVTPHRVVEAILAGARRQKGRRHETGALSAMNVRAICRRRLPCWPRPTAPPRSSPAASRLGRCSICGWWSRELIVDITGLAELKQAERRGDELVLGACVTHADIEDGRIPDVTRGAMQRRRRQYRLSRRSQSRHGRRIAQPCRSRGRLGIRAVGAGREIDAAEPCRARARSRWRISSSVRSNVRCAPARSSKRFMSRRGRRRRIGATSRVAARPASSRMRSARS